MSLTDEQIAKMFNRNIDTKTILVDKENLQSKIDEYISLGWKHVRTTEVNNKYKVTFQKEKLD